MFSTTAVTAITAQNTVGVHGVHGGRGVDRADPNAHALPGKM